MKLLTCNGCGATTDLVVYAQPQMGSGICFRCLACQTCSFSIPLEEEMKELRAYRDSELTPEQCQRLGERHCRYAMLLITKDVYPICTRTREGDSLTYELLKENEETFVAFPDQIQLLTDQEYFEMKKKGK